MARSLGDGKGRLGGRAKGTPNKATTDLQRLSAELGVHPFEILLHFAAGDWKALGYKQESYIEFGKGFENDVLYIKPETRVKAAAEAAQYLYPKRKALELTEIPIERPQAKKTFEQFCATAAYPTPFPKQIEMMEFGINNQGARMILGSRGYGKTDYVVILGIAYRLYLEPEFTCLIITKSEQRNAAMLEEISKACIANGMRFEKQNASCIRIAGLLGKDHSVSAVPIGTSSLRGRHPKLVVMDDPVTSEDISESTRNRVQRVYNEVNKLCKDILIIGQPVHKFDLYESLRPCLNKMEVPHGSIPQLDHDLEAQRLAGVDEASIQASYFLNVLSESATPFDKIKYIDKFPPGDSVAFIDPSFEGVDYTALTILKGYMQGVAVVGFAYRKSWNHALDDIAMKLLKYSVKRLCFETNCLGDQPLDILRKVFGNIGIQGRKSNTNKHSRIMNAGTFAHMIHLSKESDRVYIDQVVKYEAEHKAKHDDCPDSLASCLEWVGLIRGKM